MTLRSGVILVCVLASSACESAEAAQARRAREAWEEPCKDTATLIATNSGSPNGETCPNRLHRMRVQVASAPSHEEFGAVVFCRCERPHLGEAQEPDAGPEREKASP